MLDRNFVSGIISSDLMTVYQGTNDGKVVLLWVISAKHEDKWHEIEVDSVA